jgi:2-phospho-L-lactate guanylyltransferase
MSWVLLPVKDLVRAKTRLSGVLAPHERRALAQAMVEDVLSVLAAVSGLDGILLVSDDPAAELMAHKYAIEVIGESELDCAPGLNSVVQAATHLLLQRGVMDIMVMHADLPLVQVADVEDILRHRRESEVDVLLVPDLAGTGTNVMAFTGTDYPAFSYGPGSCQAHLAGAAERGLAGQVINNHRLGLDVDDPGDLLHLYHELLAGQRGEYSASVLLGAEISQRLTIIERGGLSPEVGQEKHDAI